ncbi:MAG: hypothetical protein HN341_02535 [Verrucomicrobia bacterium]|jgi:hypothetical protein|nr:hypothetical protein [Verrucomicrobiota bacterium]
MCEDVHKDDLGIEEESAEEITCPICGASAYGSCGHLLADIDRSNLEVSGPLFESKLVSGFFWDVVADHGKCIFYGREPAAKDVPSALADIIGWVYSLKLRPEGNESLNAFQERLYDIAMMDLIHDAWHDALFDICSASKNGRGVEAVDYEDYVMWHDYVCVKWFCKDPAAATKDVETVLTSARASSDHA